MSTITSRFLDEYDPFYPDSDGKPMAENTTQLDWIITVRSGLEILYRDNDDVFVAGDLLWYPVKGKPKICMAPDALVAFGRPKGHRHSYKTWIEGGVAPHVVMEVLSPSNRKKEMKGKLGFYETYGVEEYYIYDPARFRLRGYLRAGNVLEPIEEIQGWISPRMGVHFELDLDGKLRMTGSDGRVFVGPVAMSRERDEIALERDEIALERNEIALERDEIAQELRKAQREFDKVQSERERERIRAERMIEKLKALGLDPEA
jgi:Uma2 family endonuclease